MGRAVRWLWGLSTQPVQLPWLRPALPSSAGLLLPPEKGMPGGMKFSSAGWPPPAGALMVKSHLEHVPHHGAWSRQTGTAPKSRSHLMR